jgi:hypothetical protein
MLRSRAGEGSSEGFNGFGALGMICLLGVALQAARWRQKSSGIATTATLALMISSLIALSVFSNIKKPVFDGLCAIFLSCIFIKGKRYTQVI